MPNEFVKHENNDHIDNVANHGHSSRRRSLRYIPCHV